MISQIATVMAENLEWDCQSEHVALGINCTELPPKAYIFVAGKILSGSGAFKRDEVLSSPDCVFKRS